MEDYKKYKWFFTSNKRLVVAGKSDSSNDELLLNLKKLNREFWVAHASQPGSPFAVICARPEIVKDEDLEELAVFTGCFSKAWKLGKKTTEIHLFKLSQVEKKRGMKTGSWIVNGKIKKVKIELMLVLTKQRGTLKAVPEKSTRKIFLRIVPGLTDKTKMVEKIAIALGDIKVDKEEILSALPAGGLKIK